MAGGMGDPGADNKVGSDHRKRPVTPVPVDVEALKRLRSDQRLSQKDLATKSGISVQTISRLERRPQVADTTTVVALAKALGTPVGTLLGERTEPFKEITASPEIQEQLKEFLERLLRSTGRVPEFLNAFTRFLEGDPDKIVGAMGTIDVEEEILGLWSSILQAYEDTDWKRMVEMSDKLAEAAQRVGRPHLEALAHAYAAKALRNTGNAEALDMAKSRLQRILGTTRSALLSRLRGKILEREGEQEGARRCYEESLELSEKRPRQDLLYALERVKSLRNVADLRMKMARYFKLAEEDAKAAHLKAAERYLVEAGEAVKVLRTHSTSAAENEEGMLSFSECRLIEARGEIQSALEKIRETFKHEVVARRPYSFVKTLMFFIYACVESKQPGTLEEACSLYAHLLPLRRYLTPRLRQYYVDWVQDYEKALEKRLGKWPSEAPAKFDPPKTLLPLTGTWPTVV